MNISEWDVIYGCSAELLNKRLEAEKSNFHLEVKKEFSGIQINSTFTEWKIVNGGSSNFIVIQITSSGKVGNTICFKNMKSKLRITLSYIQKNDSLGHIILNCQKDNVVMLNIDEEGTFKDYPDNKLLLDIIKDAYIQTIEENAQKLSLALAEITQINASGIILKQIRYIWYQPSNSALTGFLIILGVLNNRDISKLPSIVDNDLLYDKNNKAYHAVFMLSVKKFNEIFMKKKMPDFFKGSQENNYRIEGSKILNNGNIPLRSVKAGAIHYNPYISSFDFHISDEKAVTILSGRCPIKGLTDAYIDFSLSSKNRILYCRKETEDIIMFESDPNFTVSVNKSIPSWEEWIGILSLGILNIVIGCISMSLEESMESGFSKYSLNAKEFGFHAVNWGVDLPQSIGGFCDNLYIQCN